VDNIKGHQALGSRCEASQPSDKRIDAVDLSDHDLRKVAVEIFIGKAFWQKFRKGLYCHEWILDLMRDASG
jgi:hypothetical protein